MALMWEDLRPFGDFAGQIQSSATIFRDFERILHGKAARLARLIYQEDARHD
jgi:hypothetical protein